MRPHKVSANTKRTGGRGIVTAVRKRTALGEKVSEKRRTHEMEDAVDCPNPAYVGVNQGMTQNLGDFNSVKIGIHVSLPCLPEDDDIRRTYVRASKLVGEFMDEEWDAAMAEDEED